MKKSYCHVVIPKNRPFPIGVGKTKKAATKLLNAHIRFANAVFTDMYKTGIISMSKPLTKDDFYIWREVLEK